MSQDQTGLSLKEQIEKKAYEFYIARGRHAGMHLQDWLAAEKEVIFETELAEALCRTKKSSLAFPRSSWRDE